MPLAGKFLRGSVGDSNWTGRNLRSTVGDWGADFGVQTGAGGELDFLGASIESSDLLHSDQIPVLWDIMLDNIQLVLSFE